MLVFVACPCFRQWWHLPSHLVHLACCCIAPPGLPLAHQVSRKEMQATLALRFGGEGILKVKGIPFKAGASDVRKFFSSYKIKPDGVSFIMHADGRPTGMAFIEFETPQEAVRAMVSPPPSAGLQLMSMLTCSLLGKGACRPTAACWQRFEPFLSVGGASCMILWQQCIMVIK